MYMYMGAQRQSHIELDNALSANSHTHTHTHIYVRTKFGSLAQMMDGLRPKKPKTMNLLRVGWKTGIK